MPTPLRFVAVGAMYPSVIRGLTADLYAAQGLGARAFPVCTALTMAGRGLVTDLTEVPEDAVRAQLEHLADTVAPAAYKVGVLAGYGAARAVLDAAEAASGPVVLDLQISGPHGETVLNRRGLTEVLDRLGVPDVLLLDAIDAELVGGGEIRSLDDAQVAAQRIVRRGARAVVIKAGTLPARHFEADAGGDGAPGAFAADLAYDGRDFALFEAPTLPDAPTEGASSAHAVALLAGLVAGLSLEDALRRAKGYVTEALRQAKPVGGEPALNYFTDYSLGGD
jgi:hydroxymethylpyrimidine/phosphomethylpyrimidine kinase